MRLKTEKKYNKLFFNYFSYGLRRVYTMRKTSKNDSWTSKKIHPRYEEKHKASRRRNKKNGSILRKRSRRNRSENT